MNIYVGNISYSTTDEDLENHFQQFGEVSSARVIRDRETQRSRGFGFVEMNNDEEATRAIEESDGKELLGRSLKVNQARERERRF